MYHAICHEEIPLQQIHKQEHGDFLQHNNRATRQDFHASILKQLKPDTKQRDKNICIENVNSAIKNNKVIINTICFYEVSDIPESKIQHLTGAQRKQPLLFHFLSLYNTPFHTIPHQSMPLIQNCLSFLSVHPKAMHALQQVVLPSALQVSQELGPFYGSLKLGMAICGLGPGFSKPRPKPTSVKQYPGPSKARPSWVGRTRAGSRRAWAGLRRAWAGLQLFKINYKLFFKLRKIFKLKIII